MTAPTIRWPGPDDVTERAGECYTLAMEFILVNARLGERLFLVHGLIHPDRAIGVAAWTAEHPDLPLPPVNPHAWCVLCLDPVTRQAMPQPDHEQMYGTETIKRYRSDIAILTAARRDSYGPWDRRSLEEWARRRAIAEADPRFSMSSAIDRFLRGTEATG